MSKQKPKPESPAVEPSPFKIKRACHDHLLVEEVEAERKTAGGIVIPQTTKEKYVKFGRVRYVGPGRILDDGKLAKPPAATGDLVMFDRFSARAHLPEATLFVVESKYVYAVLEGDGGA